MTDLSTGQITILIIIFFHSQYQVRFDYYYHECIKCVYYAEYFVFLGACLSYQGWRKQFACGPANFSQSVE